MRLEDLHAHAKFLRRSLDGLELQRTRARVPQDADALERRQRLVE